LKAEAFIGLAAVVGLIGSATAGPARPLAAGEVEDSERAWSKAYLRHDLGALSRLLADDFVGIDGRGVVSDKAAELEEARAAPPGFDGPVLVREDLSDVRVRVYGSTAILTALNTAHFDGKDGPSTIRYRRTTVWVLRDGRWQCVSFHGSRVLEAR
jgi:ketosteroid isomerase-like protein